MHFDLNDDERALKRGIRELCEGRFPMERLRRNEGLPVDRALWRELGEAGVFALRLPESDGGTALRLTQAVIVFEELGRALIPGPLVASHLAAGIVDGAGTGETIVGLVDAAHDPLFAEHLEAADVLLVLHPDAVAVADRSAVDGVPGQPLDPLTPVHRLDSIPDGARAEGQDAGRWRLEGAVLTAALQLGIATVLRERAVAYANEREQFGRPIGSFQAIKHMCADMLVREEVARAAVYAAGVSLDEHGDASSVVAAAKLTADEAAFRNGKDCVQVHGGMGYTWEVDVHLYLKRAALLRSHFGDFERHAETMAAAL